MKPGVHSPAAAFSPPVRRAVVVGGAAYIALAVAAMASRADVGAVGALCAGDCAQVTLLGIDLALWGIAAMAALVGLCLAAGRHPQAAVAGLTLALTVGGASVALAASQWIGAAPLCPLCQACAAVAVVVAALVARALSGAVSHPAWHGGLAGAAGVLGVMAAWPFLVGLPQQQIPDPPAPAVVAAAPSPPAAPAPGVYTLTMVTDFSCAVCKRFEDRVLPELEARALSAGIMRLEPVYGGTTPMTDDTRRRTVIALAAGREGISPAVYLPMLRTASAAALRNPAALPWLGDGTAARVAQAVADGYRDGTWDRTLAEHRARGAELRRLYFPGKGGTPSFVLTPPGVTAEAAAKTGNVYAFHGFQLAKPFLEFAGIGEEEG